MNNPEESLFTEQELRGIREGIDGIKRALPARFYHDEHIYQYEVEHVLKKNWLCVGRWDQAEHPGDYFTLRMWNESIVIVRDRQHDLHALINVCQHRSSQVVQDGSGNAKVFVCPYHSWSYNLDGSLRGISLQDIPELDKQKCGMPKLQVEEWHGFIFINFDLNAKPLAPQIEAVSPHFEKFGVDKYRQKDAYHYDANWNWKFSFETGYEGYHHCGLHRESINHIVPGTNTKPLDFGEACGSYTMWLKDNLPTDVKEEREQRMKEGTMDRDDSSVFIAIYPNLIMFLNSIQCTYIITQHLKVDYNYAATCQTFSPRVLESEKADEIVAEQTRRMRATQEEDTYGCTMLQNGITSATNRAGLIHPLEQQLNHYHNWYVDKIQGVK